MSKAEFDAGESLDDVLASEALESRLDDMRRLSLTQHIHVKWWPGNTITVTDMELYIDQRTAEGNPKPEVLVVDYVAKLHTPGGEKMLRQELHNYVTALRNLGIKLGIPVVTAQQTNRLGFKADQGQMSHVAESAG